MTANSVPSRRHRVVIVGAGFGGLWAVKRLKGAGVDIVLIDQRNHHLFQPLLYQVATASLAPSEVAWPIRSMLHDRNDVTTMLGTVTGVDPAGRAVRLADGSLVPYDTLILATGARHGYFGHDECSAGTLNQPERCLPESIVAKGRGARFSSLFNDVRMHGVRTLLLATEGQLYSSLARL